MEYVELEDIEKIIESFIFHHQKHDEKIKMNEEDFFLVLHRIHQIAVTDDKNDDIRMHILQDIERVNGDIETNIARDLIFLKMKSIVMNK